MKGIAVNPSVIRGIPFNPSVIREIPFNPSVMCITNVSDMELLRYSIKLSSLEYTNNTLC